jgi:hypothetical protein
MCKMVCSFSSKASKANFILWQKMAPLKIAVTRFVQLGAPNFGHFGGQCSVKIVIVQFEHLMPRRYLFFPIMLSEAGIGRFQRSA